MSPYIELCKASLQIANQPLVQKYITILVQCIHVVKKASVGLEKCIQE